MESRRTLEILRQPDDYTCGPTCLHAVYRYYGDEVPLEQVIAEVPSVSSGGTLDVLLACHALRRGYRATIYTYNLQMFDPTWFSSQGVDLSAKLGAQLAHRPSPRLAAATDAYLEFLERDGELRFEDLTTGLICRYLNLSIPVLTGLSATYLYRCSREHGPTCDTDDVRGQPAGHFVVLCGYDQARSEVLVADPFWKNPMAPGLMYSVGVDRVICAILLGILTYDANLLIIEPRS